VAVCIVKIAIPQHMVEPILNAKLVCTICVIRISSMNSAWKINTVFGDQV